MKKMPRDLLTCACVLCLTMVLGCRSMSGYWQSRIRDAGDVLSLSCGYGAGAKARMGPLQTGLLWNREWGGLRGGALGVYDDPGPVGYNSPDKVEEWDALVLRAETFILHDKEVTHRGKTYVAWGLGPVGWAWGIRQKHVYSYYTEVEAVVAMGPSLRIGVNPGEFIDFVMGVFCVDLFGDDITVPCVGCPSSAVTLGGFRSRESSPTNTPTSSRPWIQAQSNGSQDVQGGEPIVCGISSNDQKIIELIAVDVLKHADYEVTDPVEDELVIRVQTNSGGEQPTDREIFDEWSKTNSISYDLLVDHYIRNGRSIIINNLVTIDPKLKQDDLREIIWQGAFYPESAFSKKYPKAKGWVELYLPGYSKDGNYAMIRCSWVPTMHGNMGYYLFKETEKGSWQLLAKHYEYYL